MAKTIVLGLAGIFDVALDFQSFAAATVKVTQVFVAEGVAETASAHGA